MGTVKCHGTTTSLRGVQTGQRRLLAHRFESCRLRQCNDWSLVHLVTNCARAYMAIYMHVCVLIYKKGVDYLCSYITHLKEVHLRYSHIITKVCVINIIVSYVAGEQLITSMKAQLCVARATSLPSSTVDQSTGEDNVLNKILCMLMVTVVSYL